MTKRKPYDVRTLKAVLERLNHWRGENIAWAIAEVITMLETAKEANKQSRLKEWDEPMGK